MTNTRSSLGFKFRKGVGSSYAFFGGYKLIKLCDGSVLLERVDAARMPIASVPGVFLSPEDALAAVGVCPYCGRSVVVGAYIDPAVPRPV